MKYHHNWFPIIETFCDFLGIKLINKPSAISETAVQSCSADEPCKKHALLPSPIMPTLTPNSKIPKSSNVELDLFYSKSLALPHKEDQHKEDSPSLASTPRITRQSKGVRPKKLIPYGIIVLEEDQLEEVDMKSEHYYH